MSQNNLSHTQLSKSTRRLILLGFKIAGYVGVNLLLAWVLFDPFSDLHMLTMKFFYVLIAGFVITYLIGNWREYFESPLIAIGVNALIIVGIYFPFGYNLINLPPPSPDALNVMKRVQQGAVLCVESGSELRTMGRRSGGRASAYGGFPSVSNKLCSEQSQVWEELPHGWKYNKVENPGTIGSFMFSSQNYEKDFIICNEVGCTITKVTD